MKGIIQCTWLGRYGRFGNQLFQYAFARAYAERHDAVLEVPEWVGRKVFGLEDAYPSCFLPIAREDCLPCGEVNLDLFGYFQGNKCLAMLSRTKLRQWFQIRPELEAHVCLPDRPYIAAHVRRGDYCNSIYCVITRASYLRACERYGLDARQLVWTSEEEPRSFPEPGLDFLADFVVLKNSSVLLRANSTFSFWAGVLSNGKTYSPIVDGMSGEQDVEFVEGNWPRILRMCDPLEIPE